MSDNKKELSRMTIDLPIEDHRRLKSIAALNGKSMRDFVLESIKTHLDGTKIQKNTAAKGQNE